MNRTSDFFNEIRSVKRKQLIPVETNDIIRPVFKMSPFLRDAMKLYKKMKMVCKYVTEYSRQWKNNKVKLSETSESEFESFETEIVTLLKDIEHELSSLKQQDINMPAELLQEVELDLKDNLVDTRKHFQSIIDSHNTYHQFSSLLKPASSSIRLRDIVKNPKMPSRKPFDHMINSLSAEERDRLLSENVQIEKSLETELEAVKQVERNTTELTHLIATFNQHIAEQHEMVDTVHDNTQTAKEHVDEGYKHLLKAEENHAGTRLKLAYFIFLLTFILLVFHWIKYTCLNQTHSTISY